MQKIYHSNILRGQKRRRRICREGAENADRGKTSRD